MSGIKLSPLFIFLLMLIVLVVATTVKRWGLVSEGFISYLKSSDSFSSQTVKAYDNTANIYKLYDDIFYDQRNGNVVVVGSSKYVDTTDTTGSTVSTIDIIPRGMDDIYSYKRGSGVSIMSQQCVESKKRTIDSLETQWYINTVQNQLVYITWGSDTYMCALDLTNVSGNTVAGNTASYQPAITAYFNGTVKQSTNTYSDANTIPLVPKFTYVSDGKDDTNVVVDFYDKVATVYQLATGIYYDYKNGNLITKSAGGTSATLNVYTRGSKTAGYTYNSVPTSGNTTLASQLTFSQSSIAPYFINIFDGKYTVMYWANGDTTIIVVFVNFLQTDGSVGCIGRRFTRDGLYSSVLGDNNKLNDKGSENKEIDTDANKDLLDSFARWYIYFNTNAIGSSDYNDYLLKTQIVPPVCPACPGCGTGVCTDCGGKGGSGTKTTDSTSLAFDNKTVVGATGSAVTNTVNAAGTAVNKTIDVAGSAVNKTVDVAGNVAGKTLDTAGNVVGKTLDTATGVVGKTFDVAGNVLGSAASTLGLDRIGYNQSYRGPANTSSSGNASGYPSSGFKNTEYRPGSNNTGVPNYPNSNPNDPYSYNGALQSKGGNFIAVTADFSRFGR